MINQTEQVEEQLVAIKENYEKRHDMIVIDVIWYCNVPEIVDLGVKFFSDNKLKRVLGENARSFIEGILSVRQGTPHLIGKFLHGVIEYLKEK